MGMSERAHLAHHWMTEEGLSGDMMTLCALCDVKWADGGDEPWPCQGRAQAAAPPPLVVFPWQRW